MTTLLIAAVLGFQGMPADQRTPEATIRSYVRFLMAKNVQHAYGCLKTSKPLNASGAQMLTGAMANTAIKIVSIESKINETSATAKVIGEVTTTNPKTNESRKSDTNEVVNLVLDGALWKIVPPNSTDLPGDSPVINWTATMLIQGDSFFANAKVAAQQTASLSNIKQLGLALIMYSTDHKDRLPKSAHWIAAIRKYMRYPSLLRAPGLAKNDPVSDYAFNSALSGFLLEKISDPAKTIMVYLGKQGRLNFAYGGKTVVVFADGSAKAITPAEAKKLRWKPQTFGVMKP